MPGSNLRRRLTLLFVVIGATLLVVRPQASRADSLTYYPQTGHYLGGGFRDFWNTQGGLSVFGYPMSEEYTASNGRISQWFERARFELAPNGTIELGLLGNEATAGRVFPQIAPRPNDANHRFFPQTNHMIMWGFKTIWETKGGLPIFGYPISEEMQEMLPTDGKWHIVQYFERARFEYWPDFKPGERVLISDLGRRLAPLELTAPLPPEGAPRSAPPITPPAPNPGSVPPSVNATVTPPSGPIGTVFGFNAFGFIPAETIALWITAPDQSVVPVSFAPTAEPDGSIASAGITFTAVEGLPTGIWAITAQGKTSGKAGIGFFMITGAATSPPVTSLPADQNARIEPREGSPGTVFQFFAGGFVAGENVTSVVYNSDGQAITNVLVTPADASGSIDYAQLRFASSVQTAPGIYQIHAIGDSKREAFGHLRITGGSPALLALRANGQPDGVSALSGLLQDALDR